MSLYRDCLIDLDLGVSLFEKSEKEEDEDIMDFWLLASYYMIDSAKLLAKTITAIRKPNLPSGFYLKKIDSHIIRNYSIIIEQMRD